MPTPLEVDYSPSSMVDDIGPFIQRYYDDSERVRREAPPLTLSYGPLPRQKIDYFTAVESDAIVIVFIHGGYWQDLDRSSASFPAPDVLAAGHSYAAIGYTLAPAASIAEIVAEVRSAVAHLYRYVRETMKVPRLIVAGSSAGAHLAAMVGVTDWSGECDLPSDVVSGLALLSGVYDLAPLIDTYINEPLRLDEVAAKDSSPMSYVANWPAIPTLIAVGEIETPAFKSQSAMLADALRDTDRRVELIEVARRNHFDIVHDLADPATKLGGAVNRLIATV